MKSKSVLLIAFVVGIAFLKVLHKNREATSGLQLFGGKKEQKEYMSSSEIRKYVQGSWKSRNTYPDAKIELQGDTLILTRGESREELTISSVGYDRIEFEGPSYFEIEFFHTKDSILISYDMKGAESIMVLEYYDRVEE